jgi:chromate reductase, NAD(P)H dehydrogenase (quinone)
MANRTVGVFVGSLRKESFNRKMANNLIKLAPEGLKLEIIEIGNLPFYNEDIEKTAPAEWIAFREKVKAVDAVLFVTPEYNRSVPAVLKNAIDVASRPYGKAAWAGKPGAVVSVSASSIGGFGANHHLRQSMVFLDVPMMQQPEVYVGMAAERFDENGEIKAEATRELMKKFLTAFATWIERNARG